MLTERKFEHEGVTYTLRQPTIFDEEMQNAAWLDLANALVKAKGFGEITELPYSLQRLSSKFISWMQVTNVSGGQLKDVDVYAVELETFDYWRKAIVANGQALAIVWNAAYEALLDKPVDEKKEVNADSNGTVSEPMKNAVIDSSN